MTSYSGRDGNPGGPGGTRRPIKTGGGGNKPPKKKFCDCPMRAAVVSVKKGKFRLARRYAAMSVRLIAARVG